MTVLVAGLGNPGERYAKTRHNAGFMLADRLAALCGAPSWREAMGGLATEVAWGPRRLVLLKPLTFMNLSGEAVNGALNALKIQPSALLVAVDELQLPVGRLKLSTGGSDGGHNGLKSLDACVGTQAYRRLRIGVGPHPKGGMADFVLSDFAEHEWSLLAATLEIGATSVLGWARGGGDERGYAAMVAAANAKANQPLDRLLAAKAAADAAQAAAAKAAQPTQSGDSGSAA